PLIGVPLLIEGGRRLIRRYFAVRRGKLHAVLKRHRASQREKIEELKRKTAYYKTKGLIERYDATASPSRPLAGPASSDAGSAPWRRDALARRGDERSAMSPASSSSSTAALLPPRPDIIDPGAPVTVRPKSWMDRVMDTVIGDTDGPNNRYALICSQCHTHNGLALPQDFLTL
ncbi:hypothetical protein CXG81DRAFT_8306, partial [Caulochytrium protostelioides]